MKKTRVGRVLRLIFLSLFMLACLRPCYVPPEEVRMARSNELDEVIGEVELLIPAERNHHGVYVSPDGRKLLAEIGEAAIVMDFVSGEEERVKPDCEIYNLRWLDDSHFVVEGGVYCYHVVDVRDLSVTRIELFPKEQLDGVREVELLRQADQLYALKDFGGSGYTLLALDEEFRYVFRLGRTDAEVETLLAEIPHVAVPRRKKCGAEKCPSLNGEFYTQTFTSAGRAGYLGIFSKDGELLSRVYKKGWSPWVLGWAHDSSGVYFEMQVGTVDGAVIYPWVPVFKLLVPGAVKRGTPVPMYTPTPTSEGGIPGATVLPLETLVP